MRLWRLEGPHPRHHAQANIRSIRSIFAPPLSLCSLPSTCGGSRRGKDPLSRGILKGKDVGFHGVE